MTLNRRTAMSGLLASAAAAAWTPPSAFALGLLALDSHQAVLVVLAAVLLGFAFGFAFGGSLRYLGRVVPADHRGEVMSAYYLLAYTAMAVPKTKLAGKVLPPASAPAPAAP